MSPEARAEYLSAQTARRFEKHLKALAVFGDFMASKTFLAFNARGIGPVSSSCFSKAWLVDGLMWDDCRV